MDIIIDTITDTTKDKPRIALDTQQQAAFAIMQSGKNVFLTGMAGTGKSLLIQQFVGASFNSNLPTKILELMF